jgi:hypothetical protein
VDNGRQESSSIQRAAQQANVPDAPDSVFVEVDFGTVRSLSSQGIVGAGNLRGVSPQKHQHVSKLKNLGLFQFQMQPTIKSMQWF